MNLDDCRRFYADEIRFAGGIRSAALIEAFARVPREHFLGPGPWELGSPDARAMSAMGNAPMQYTAVDDPRHVYHDVVIALDKAADINNGQPSALARWMDALELKAGDRAYHLGCGVGYYTAIIAETVGPEGSVVASEVNSALATRAKKNLSAYSKVTVHSADGATFDPGDCDAIFVNAGMTHPLPLWLDRLKEGGRMVFPLTMGIKPTVGVGLMTRVVREQDKLSAQIVSATGIYSCTNARDPERDSLIRSALTNGRLMNMKSVRRDLHEAAETCLVHGRDVCISAAE